jgi:hypothetical protein
MVCNLAALAVLFAVTSLAQAQATRTWVSGVGDDANPCSRTAPCKTFAGAISKTATGGEIDVLDPGGFGAVTITKSISIEACCIAGVLVSGTNGIVISVPNATDAVVLRGLTFEGLGTGLSAVLVNQGGTVQIEDCTINNFTNSGINFAPTVAGSQLHVTNTKIRRCGASTNGNGILIQPTAAATATVDHVLLEYNNVGLKAFANSNTTVTDTIATNSAFAGFSGAASGAVLNIEGSSSSNNGSGVVCAAGSTVRIGTSSLFNNGTPVTPGACFSFGNNHIDAAVTMTAISPAQQ